MRLCLLVAAFLTAFVFSCADEFAGGSNIRLGKSPAAGLCADLVEPAGYPCTEHIAQTKDGYFLGLQRVSSRSGSLRGPNSPPVLLLHGLMMSGDAWFLDSPNQSLGFILADHGFDVWAGNVRGTHSSRGHVHFSDKDKEFWNFSWQELALYDLPGMASYISNITNSKIFIVGHSQGTIMSLAAFTHPDIVSMVEAAALLCPISYLDHITTKLVLTLVEVHFDEILFVLGIHEVHLKSDLPIRILETMCNEFLNWADLLTSVTGKNCCFNRSRIDFYLKYVPQPTSTKNFNHLFQMIRHGTFKMYDYGMWKNLNLYGQMDPPKFDLTKIPKSLPLWMAYGGTDALADVTDVQHMLRGLRSKPELLYLENYGHIDFLLGVRSKEDVYDKIIEFFRSQKKFSSY